MKKALLFLLLISSVFAQAQTLKDALFSGKLKNDPGTVIRKGDDLSTKIDTTTHAATPATVTTPSTNNSTTQPDAAVVSTTTQTDNAAKVTDNNTSATDTAAGA